MHSSQTRFVQPVPGETKYAPSMLPRHIVEGTIQEHGNTWQRVMLQSANISRAVESNRAGQTEQGRSAKGASA
eukprot:6407784-Alexandrium_andersonii.AAC.1